ncbi:hypothetical protein NEF87_002355 [Candidatus Lokiarchaeum ossiferum]|uniref:HTH hxlR-type domain-containing protein n=1 Tax=Candidatus Lokiarchaeum ossiferum TaxID=2951803 RepID=A0ABY6HRP0_9ARCH|nr:hypothetical protein NEF87_002355 [Candidatus Lokiarchaeum sp. B-35]
MIKILKGLNDIQGPFQRVIYRKSFNVSSKPAMRDHDLLYKHKLIRSVPDPSRLLFEVTEKGKIVAQLVNCVDYIIHSPYKNSDFSLPSLKKRKKKKKKPTDFIELIPKLSTQLEAVLRVLDNTVLDETYHHASKNLMDDVIDFIELFSPQKKTQIKKPAYNKFPNFEDYPVKSVGNAFNK